MKNPYIEIDHSGDIGIEATGTDLKSLFENAALGLFGLMARGEVGTSEKRTIKIHSNSYEDLLIDWLSELISQAALEGDLYASVSIDEIGEYYLSAVVHGEKVDAEKHDLRFEVKAATYHRLAFRRDGDVFFARVIFDL